MFRRPCLVGIVLATTLMLSACGFQLRGTGQEVARIPALYLSVDNNFGEVSRSIKSALTDNGTEIVADPAGAPWSLFISAEKHDRRIASTSNDISVARYELLLQIVMRLEAQDGTPLIPATELSTERVYDYDSSNLTGSSVEESVLKEEMRAELIERILRRVAMTISSQSMP